MNERYEIVYSYAIPRDLDDIYFLTKRYSNDLEACQNDDPKN